MNLLDASKKQWLKEIEKAPLFLIGSEKRRNNVTSKDGSETYPEDSLRLSVEIPRGRGWLSRVRFDVKIVDGTEKVTQEELDERDYLIRFENLVVKYIDGERRNVYFGADDYEIQEVDN